MSAAVPADACAGLLPRSELAPTRQLSPGEVVVAHLLPGVLAFAVMALALAPGLPAALGIPAVVFPIVTFLAAIAVVIVPLPLLFVAWQHRRRFGRWGLRGELGLQRCGRLRDYWIVLPLVGWMLFWFAGVAHFVNGPITQAFFSWFPQELRFQQLLHEPDAIAALPGIGVIAPAYLLLACLLGPVAEELYFRAWLLPRMRRYGAWAPVINTVLFSLYHLFSPWENPVRIIGTLPLVWLAWRRDDVRVAAIPHVIGNTMGGLAMLWFALG